MANIHFEKDFSKHPLHYINLISLMLVGLWLLFWFGSNQALKLSIVIVMSMVYVTWGVVHHKQHNDLHPKIILEYIAVALMAVVVYATLLYRT